jgi:hypothetical protein
MQKLLHSFKMSIFCLFLILMVFSLNASQLSDGYILCGANGGSASFLLDNKGDTAFTWDHSKLPDNMNGYSCYLLENGHLLRSAQVASAKNSNFAPVQGIIDEIDSAGKVVWTYTLSNDTFMTHHDMKWIKKSGHILATSFVYQTKADMIKVGVDTNLIKGGTAKGIVSDRIIEIDPATKTIVWEWRAFDHVVPKDSAAAHPERISGSIVSALWQGQWMHLNGLDYNEKTDMIVFSSRIFSEVFVIDHSTTKAEAAGHTGGTHKKGGDILYRWGNPGNYGASGAYKIDCCHSTTWVPEGYPGAGNIMFFHNNTAAVKSEVVEIKPTFDANGEFQFTSGKPFDPIAPTWKYAPASGFYSQFMSSAMSMPNGNRIAHESFPMSQRVPEGTVPATNSIVREITPQGDVVWMDTLNIKSSGMMALNPSKIMYYPSSYIGVRKLLKLSITSSKFTSAPIAQALKVQIRRNAKQVVFSEISGCTIGIYNLQGGKVFSSVPVHGRVTVNGLSKGAYVAVIQSEKGNSRTWQVVP